MRLHTFARPTGGIPLLPLLLAATMAAGAACRGGEPGSLTDPPAMVCKPNGSIMPEPSRRLLCAIDVGSRNVKLIVSSLKAHDQFSFKNERQCRARMQLADRTTDKASGAPKPLSPEDQEQLIDLFKAYKQRCEEDGGRLVGMVATEWARQVPNAADVVAAVERKAGMRLEILGKNEEARFGYLAATQGARGKLVLDFGSRSLQLSFWARSSPDPVVHSVALGIDAAGDRFFGAPGVASYAAGQDALKQALRAELEPFFARVRDARGQGEVGGQLFSLGENGDLSLALEGRLWSGSRPRAVSESSYASAVKGFQPTRDPSRGLVSAVFTPQQLAEPTRLYEQNPALFEDLRSAKLKRVFGNKMLVFPALIALLEAELDLDEVVLVPQEMADGVLLERLEGDGAPTAAR